MNVYYSEKETPRFEVSENTRIYTSSSSKGNQPKWCKKGKIWLKSDYLGYEGLSETVASELLAKSNISNFVRYQLCSIEDLGVDKDSYNFITKGCYSYDFRGVDSIITLYRLLKSLFGVDVDSKSFYKLSTKDKITTAVDLVSTLIPNFGEWLTAQLEFDAFILNEDRHTRNVIIMMEDNGNYKTAPFFDCGAGFLSDIHMDYPMSESTHKLVQTVRAKPFSTDFKKQVDAARELYGPQLKLNISNGFKVHMTLYSKEIVNRINQVIAIQSEYWKDMII